MDLADFVAAEVYGPAGMVDSTRDRATAAAYGNTSFGHADDGTIYAADSYPDMNSGFVSARDLGLWVRMMVGGENEVLSRGAVAMLQEPQTPMYHKPGRPSSIGGGSYGFGVFIDEYPAGTVSRTWWVRRCPSRWWCGYWTPSATRCRARRSTST